MRPWKKLRSESAAHRLKEKQFAGRAAGRLLFFVQPLISLTAYISDLAFCLSTSLLSLCCDQCIISRYQHDMLAEIAIVLLLFLSLCIGWLILAVNRQAPARVLEPQLYSSWKIGTKLTEDNYTIWARSMIRAMEDHGVISAIESSLEPQDRRALTMIVDSIEQKFNFLAEDAPNALHAWSALSRRLDRTDHLLVEAIKAEMGKGRLVCVCDVEAHLERLEALFVKLKRAGLNRMSRTRRCSWPRRLMELLPS